MSLTILSGVSSYHSTEYLYNPIYYSISGTNSNHLNFKYIVDVAASNIYLGRYKFYPNPTTGIGYFDVHSIIQDSVDNTDFNPTITTPTLNNSGFIHYVIGFGDEYDLSPSLTAATGTTIYPLQQFAVGYGLNAVQQFDETFQLHDYDWNAMTGSHQTKFLTNWNYSYSKKIFLHEYETTCIYTTYPNFSVGKYQIVTFDVSGQTLGSYLMDFSGGTNPLTYRHELPIGTQNFYINAFNNVTSTIDLIMKPNVGSYNVKYYDTSLNDSVEWTYIINTICPRFDLVRICWINRFGYYDYFTFNLMKRDFIQTKRTEWTKKIDQNYSLGKRGRTTLSSNGQESFQVTTDWLTSYESEFLSILFTSPHVYLINSSGNKIPLMLKSTDFEIKNLNNDRLINYTIDFDYAIKTYGQNG
jgi:hypothetical protein